jgi:O-antigen/teichoic acid export membrane protein
MVSQDLDFARQIKGLSRDILVYGLAGSISACVGIVTAPILTRIFVPAEYGIISLINTTVGFFLMFGGFNLVSGVYRFYYESDSEEERADLVSTCLILFLIISVFLVASVIFSTPVIKNLLFGGRKEYPYESMIFVAALRIPFAFLLTYFLSLLRLRRQSDKVLILTVVQVVVNLGLIFLLIVVLRKGMLGAIWAVTLSETFMFLVSLLMVYRSFRIRFSTYYLKCILSYCLPAFPSVCINWGMLQFNRFFMSYYSPFEQLGYYSIADKIAAIIIIFTAAFRTAYLPFSMQVMRQPDHREIYRKIFRLYVIVFSLLSMCIAVFSKLVLYILAPAIYEPAYTIVIILVCANMIMGVNPVLQVGISISKRTKYVSYAQFFVFCTIIMANFALIPSFGAWGAAAALLIGAVAQSIFFILFSNKVYPINFPLKTNTLYFLSVFVLGSAHLALIKDLNFIMNFTASVSVLTLIAVYTWVVWLRKEEKEAFINMFKKQADQREKYAPRT